MLSWSDPNQRPHFFVEGRAWQLSRSSTGAGPSQSQASTAGSFPPLHWRFTSRSGRLTRSASSTCRSVRPSASPSRRPTTGSSARWAGCSAWPSSSSACRRSPSGAGSTGSARARRCSPRPSASAGGFLVGAAGIWTHQFWLLYLGYGVLGGIGLGLGYISPVSTLIKLVPRPAGHGDRPRHHGLRRRCHDRIAARRSG